VLHRSLESSQHGRPWSVDKSRYNDGQMKRPVSDAIWSIFVASAIAIAHSASAQDTLLPPPVKPSDLELRLDFVVHLPTHRNPTSPVGAGSPLLLIDQAGYLYR